MRTHTVTRLLDLVSVLLTAALVSPSGSFGQERDGRQALSSTLAKLEWRTIGPAAKSGRIGDLTAVKSDPDIVYVATSTGGAWKSTNRGITWEEIFKNRGTASLGAIAVAPDNPNLVWLGSGENWNARSASWGDGVYKSEDGGKSWKHMGLEETRHTGKIVIHPGDPDIVYVAGMGALWGANEERGVFKTTDGGETWEKVLFVSQYTGVSDVEMDPRDPALLYAAAFQRERRNWSFLGGGPEGGIYRTTDGGATWQELQTACPRATSAASRSPSVAARPTRSTRPSAQRGTRKVFTAPMIGARAGSGGAARWLTSCDATPTTRSASTCCATATMSPRTVAGRLPTTSRDRKSTSTSGRCGSTRQTPTTS